MRGRIGILLSGRGSNFLAIQRHIEAGDLDADITCVISNRRQAPGLAKAEALGIPAYYVRTAGDREGYEREMGEILERHGATLVCLAGFMRILGPELIRRFPNRILNIHPALLPSFPGLHAQQQALDYGVKVSGCTVHLVDEGMDTGPIVVQAVVPVLDDDTEETLSARILVEEHRIYSLAIRLVLENQCVIDGRRVIKKN